MPDEPASASDGAASNGRGPWTTPRVELHGWLEANAPLAASIYAGAVAILEDDGIPGRNYFIWHAIREIRVAIPRAINGPSERFDADQHIRDIAAAWRKDGLSVVPLERVSNASAYGPVPNPDPARPEASNVPATTISSTVATRIVRMIYEFEDVSNRFRAANQEALTKVLGRDVPAHVARAWTDAFERAPRFAHLPQTYPTIDEIANAVDGFIAFEDTLMTITRKSFENMDELDAILASTQRR